MKNNNIFPLERNHYFYGKLLTVRDFELEQTYVNNKRRLINRAIHGTGVVCGLGVTKVDDFTLIVESGLALDYKGREIVVDTSVVRKLQMIDGYEDILNSRKAYLCLRYDEKENEPVSALVSGVQSTENNKTEESYRLYLESQEPDIKSILSSAGDENVNIMYQSSEITVAFSMPIAVLAGQEFTAKLTVIKSTLQNPILLGVGFKSEYITDQNGSDIIAVKIQENPEEQKYIWSVPVKLKAANLSGSMVELCNSGATMRIINGESNEKFEVPLKAQVQICENMEELQEYKGKKDNLMTKINGIDLPIYLAKIQVIPNANQTMIGDVHSLPFVQRLARENAVENTSNFDGFSVSSEVEVLKSWQKPEAQALYNHSTSSLHFKFALPSNDDFDYSTSSGVVEIPMSTGMRVNARYASKEVPHNLGIGNVDVRVWVEYKSENEVVQFFGNREVFKTKEKDIPQIQTAVMAFPERGTFKVGVWLLDNVEGSVIRVRYFASKVKRDVDAMKKADRVTIEIVPEVQFIKVHDRLYLKANVHGSNDRSVSWKVKDKDGGTIDQNGLYQAPDTKGTYEVIATSNADPTAMISTFIIVEE